MKTAFEKPFRNNATTSLALLASQKPRGLPMGDPMDPIEIDEMDDEELAQTYYASAEDKGKGKASESSGPEVASVSRSAALPRESSPEWDIEKDLVPPPRPRPTSGDTHQPPRPESPPWDIELELN
jgi:DNA excision repair protein ERCC-1